MAVGLTFWVRVFVIWVLGYRTRRAGNECLQGPQLNDERESDSATRQTMTTKPGGAKSFQKNTRNVSRRRVL